MRAMGLSQGMDFSSAESRDVAWLGDCDEGCKALATSLGWAVSFRHLLQYYLIVN